MSDETEQRRRLDIDQTPEPSDVAFDRFVSQYDTTPDPSDLAIIDYQRQYGDVIPDIQDMKDPREGESGFETDPNKYPIDYRKLLDTAVKSLTGTGKSVLTGMANDPISGLMKLFLLSKLMKGGDKPQIAGYKGPGINMGLTATRAPVSQPSYQPYSGQAVMGRQMVSPVTFAAHGGIMGAAQGRYLRGQTDGMADQIATSIDDDQPAKLSHGEFVIPADVVSHLGNGNSDAGAKVLYKMMDRVRTARTGTKEQGKRINPDKFTPGGIAGYAGGGAVAFNNGGGISTQTQTGPAVTTQTPEGTSTEQNIASWAGPYVMDYLSKSRALAQLPYQAYQGPLTAGYSPLQQQAFGAFQNLQMPWQYGAGSGMAYQAGLGSFTQPGTSQAFMSPYIQDVMDVEKREAQRQADIARTQRSAQAVKAGAFGGSRQAIMDAEAQRNLAQQMGDIQTKGLQSAFDRAAQQYNAERTAQLQAAMGLGTLGTQQFGAQMQGLQGLLGAGGTQRDIEQQGVKALMDEYNKQLMWPYQQLEFQKSMLQGLPVSAQGTTPNMSEFDRYKAIFGDIAGLFGGK